jgi:peptide/nickel transport system permease protein
MATPMPQGELLPLPTAGAMPGWYARNRWVAWRLVPLALLVLLALVGPVLTEFDPERANPRATLEPPSAEHWFGTNSYGGDVFSRVVHAARLDLFIAFVSVAVSFAIGTPLGALVGYSRRWWAGAVMRFMDFVQSFPLFIIALAVVTVTGPSTWNVIFVLALLNVPIFVRLVRAEVLSLRERSFVEAARCLGDTDARIVATYVLPNSIASSLSQASVNVGWALLLTAGLGFVGAGIRPPTPEWGVMIGEGARNMITGEWWVSLFPGLALGVAVLAFALAGDALARLLDVRARSSR